MKFNFCWTNFEPFVWVYSLHFGLDGLRYIELKIKSPMAIRMLALSIILSGIITTINMQIRIVLFVVRRVIYIPFFYIPNYETNKKQIIIEKCFISYMCNLFDELIKFFFFVLLKNINSIRKTNSKHIAKSQ